MWIPPILVLCLVGVDVCTLFKCAFYCDAFTWDTVICTYLDIYFQKKSNYRRNIDITQIWWCVWNGLTWCCIT
jgi:hypothetical protein